MSRQPSRFDVKYLMGHPLIGEPMDLTLVTGREGISLLYYEPTLWAQSTEKAKIAWEAVGKISVETQGEVRKRVSAGRTAAGLVLFGPVGALIGAGLRKREDTRHMYVSIVCKDETGIENTLLLESKDAYAIANRLTFERYDHYKALTAPPPTTHSIVTPTASSTQEGESVATILGRWWGRFARWWRPQPVWLKAFIIAIVLVAVVRLFT